MFFNLNLNCCEKRTKSNKRRPGNIKPVPTETMGQAKACTHGNHGSSFSLVPTSKHKSLYVIKEIIFNISILNNNDSG